MNPHPPSLNVSQCFPGHSCGNPALFVLSEVVRTAGRPRRDNVNVRSIDGGTRRVGMGASASAPKLGGTSKGQRLNIKDIVERDTGAGPSTTDMIKSMEGNVRKVLKAKQTEYDRVMFALRKRRAELEKLELTLRDLKRDGEALGLEECPDKSKRLQPVKTISNRPMYAKNTKIDKQVQELAERKHSTQKVIMTHQIYEHMRKRLMAEIVEEKKRNHALQDRLNSENIRNADLKRQHIAVGEALGKSLAQLAKLRKDVEHELFLWREEIKDRENWAKQKQGFEDFLAQQMARQQKLAASASADSKEEPSQGSDARVSKAMGEAYLQASGEDSKYEAAFRRIGVNPEDVDADKIISACKQQDAIRRDLIRRRAAEEQRVAYLQQQLTDAQRTLQATLADRERTTNRVLSETERDLSEAETKLEAERSEFQFLQHSLQPVKIGLQQLAFKVLGVSVDLTDAEEITLVLSKIQHRLASVLEESSRLLSAGDPASSKVPPPPTVSQTVVHEGKDLKPTLHASYIDPHKEAPDWLVTEFNVRVGPSASEDASSSGRQGSTKRKPRRLAGLGVVDGDGDAAYSSDSDTEVLDRDDLKKVAQSILHHSTRKARRKKDGSA